MENHSRTIGLDLGDKSHRFCMLDASGEIRREGQLGASPAALSQFFGGLEPAVVAIEAGTHSPWISRLLGELGHRVLVGNPRKLRMIWGQAVKTDRRDAAMLARIARFDPQLLSPITHRGAAAQADLAIIKARATVVRMRATLINHVRGTVKAMGHRLKKCSAPAFANKTREQIPEALRAALDPLMDLIGELSVKIRDYDRRVEELGAERYPETSRLRQVAGVGPITALSYVLNLERAERFARSRSVGCYLGLTPRKDQSGEVDKALRITKAGDRDLRALLVGCSHYIMGPFGPPSALRRWGLKLAARGGGAQAKRRAVVAVARKLAVLLHRLWAGGAPYEPFPPPRGGRRGRALRAAA